MSSGIKAGLQWGCVRVVEALKRDMCGNRHWRLHCDKCGRDFTRSESALFGWGKTRTHCPLCKPPRVGPTLGQKQKGDSRKKPVPSQQRVVDKKYEALRDPILRCPKCADQPWRRPHRLGIATEACVCGRMYGEEKLARGPCISSHSHGMAMGVGR